MSRVRGAACLVAAVALLLGGCGSSSDSTPPADPTPAATADASSGRPGASPDDTKFPDVLEARASRAGDGSWTFDVTISSPYDSPERYADGWRVMSGKEVLGEMTLGHDHASEQPFTRTQTGVEIPDGVDTVTVQGRDTEHGYGGTAVTVDLPR